MSHFMLLFHIRTLWPISLVHLTASSIGRFPLWNSTITETVSNYQVPDSGSRGRKPWHQHWHKHWHLGLTEAHFLWSNFMFWHLLLISRMFGPLWAGCFHCCCDIPALDKCALIGHGRTIITILADWQQPLQHCLIFRLSGVSVFSILLLHFINHVNQYCPVMLFMHSSICVRRVT